MYFSKYIVSTFQDARSGHGPEDSVLGASDRGAPPVRQQPALLPAQPPGDRLPLQRYWTVKALAHRVRNLRFFAISLKIRWL